MYVYFKYVSIPNCLRYVYAFCYRNKKKTKLSTFISPMLWEISISRILLDFIEQNNIDFGYIRILKNYLQWFTRRSK